MSFSSAAGDGDGDGGGEELLVSGLLNAALQCSCRGLFGSAAWATELLMHIDNVHNVDDVGNVHGLFALKSKRHVMALHYMHLREYGKICNLLAHPKSALSVAETFIYNYADLLVCLTLQVE